MSSIYKKGRDGYYYYQAYVFNPKTKKRDKRVFHALSTKNLHEAKEKQDDLDLKYDEKHKPNINATGFGYNIKIGAVSFIIITIICTITYYTNDYNMDAIYQTPKDFAINVGDASNKTKHISSSTMVELVVNENLDTLNKVKIQPKDV